MRKMLTVLLSSALLAGVLSSLPVQAADHTVTRESAVSAFVRATGEEHPEADMEALQQYTDADEVEKEYQNDLAWAASEGLLDAICDGSEKMLRPKEPMSRLDAAVFVSRCLPELETPEEIPAFEDVPEEYRKDVARIVGSGMIDSYAEGFFGAEESVSAGDVDRLANQIMTHSRYYEPLSREGYTLEKVVLFSRHGIRTPTTKSMDSLSSLTPHEWYEWEGNAGELSLRGYVLETLMGQYFRAWLESEGLITENAVPEEGEMRFQSNGRQRTIVTGEAFTSSFLPVAGIQLTHLMPLETEDPDFTRTFAFNSEKYKEEVLRQFAELGGEDGIAGLMAHMEEELQLLSDVVDFTESEAYLSGEIPELTTKDTGMELEDDKPDLTGTYSYASDLGTALVLQYYEDPDPQNAAFGKELTWEQWRQIGMIKSEGIRQRYMALSLVSLNSAASPIREIKSELFDTDTTFAAFFGHDTNISTILSAMGVEYYILPYTLEQYVPLGGKVVFARWKSEEGEEFVSVDYVYQTAEQMRNQTKLTLENPPMSFPLYFPEIEKNADGLYPLADLEAHFEDMLAMSEAIPVDYAD